MRLSKELLSCRRSAINPLTPIGRFKKKICFTITFDKILTLYACVSQFLLFFFRKKEKNHRLRRKHFLFAASVSFISDSSRFSVYNFQITAILLRQKLEQITSQNGIVTKRSWEVWKVMKWNSGNWKKFAGKSVTWGGFVNAVILIFLRYYLHFGNNAKHCIEKSSDPISLLSSSTNDPTKVNFPIFSICLLKIESKVL